MPRLAESISLQMNSCTLHAQLATDGGYVSSSIDLKSRIGNVKGKFVVGEEWKSDINWSRWVSRPFRGTVMHAKLRDDEDPYAFARGNWVDGEIDLGKHVHWSGKDLAFCAPGDDSSEEEGSVIQGLSPTDRLELQNDKLIAHSSKGVQSIHLNPKLGNDNGSFDLKGGNFSLSARNCKVDGTVLSAELAKINGTWEQDQIDLRRFVKMAR